MGDTMRRFASPWFIAAVVLMLAAIVGLRPAAAGLSRYFAKESIELRLPLDDFDFDRIESFRHIPGLELSTTTDADIGTSEWITELFLPVGNTVDQTTMLVTYYSDPRDRVPHTPEVCYRQSGAFVSHVQDDMLPTPELGPAHTAIPVRQLMATLGDSRTLIVYTFFSNDRFYCDRERLRLTLGLPGDKYVFFSKVEAVTSIRDDETMEDAAARARRLLGELLPPLLDDHFPRPEDTRRR